MSGKSSYFGIPEQAARLRAARISAGFATAREAALRFGWGEPRYMSHEGAKRRMDAYLDDYALAFGVSPRWLGAGIASPPPYRDGEIEVSGSIVESLSRRKIKQTTPGSTDMLARGRRLRLARRLAGYRSVALGANAAGVHRTTLHAQEHGRLGFDTSGARKYAMAFACEPEWLLHGHFPSGYPGHVAALLHGLIDDFSLREGAAATRLPKFTPRATPLSLIPSLDPRPATIPKGMPIPDFQIQDLAAAVAGTTIARKKGSSSGWSAPRHFLQRSLRATPEKCVILAVPVRYDPGPFNIKTGDRLIVDTSAIEPFASSFAIAREDNTLLVVDAGTETGLRTVIAAAERRRELVLLGKIVGLLVVVS